MCLYFTENIPFVDFPQTLSSSFIIVCWWRCQNNKVISNIISLFKVKLYLLSETSKLQTSSSADFVSDVVRNEQLWTLTALSLDHWLPCWQHLPEKNTKTQTNLESRKTSRLLTPDPPWSSWYTAPSSCSLSWPTWPGRWPAEERTGRSTSQT